MGGLRGEGTQGGLSRGIVGEQGTAVWSATRL